MRARFCIQAIVVLALAAGPLTAQSRSEPKSDRAASKAKAYDPSLPLAQYPVEIPPVYCETCIRQKRIEMKRRSIRLLEMDGRHVIDFIRKKPVHYLEWDHIKFVSQIPSVNLAVEMMPKLAEEKRNWKFLKQEIDDLKPLFSRARVGTLNSHQMAHLMMNRLIRFYKRFEKEMDFWKAVDGLVLADYGLGPHLGMRAPFEIYVLRGKNDYLKWEDKFLGKKSIVGQKWHLFKDRALVFTTYYDGGIKLFNNFLQHNFAHILLWGYRGWTFELPGWMHIGFAHWVERNITPKFNTTCYDEGGEPSTVKGWRWEIRVRKDVVADAYRPLPELKPKVSMADFSGNDHLICWSIVRFMIEHDRKKWRDFVDKVSLPERMSQDEALRKSYGWSFNRLEELWRDHVLKTYPKP